MSDSNIFEIFASRGSKNVESKGKPTELLHCKYYLKVVHLIDIVK